MIRFLIAPIVALALMPATASAACQGPNPAITHVAVQTHMTRGQATMYHLVGTVTNEGTSGQPSNVLQFVDIWHDGDKLDSRGIPPLPLGGSHNFSYDFIRASDAGAGTTTLVFKIDITSGSNCSDADDTYKVTF
ncbi:MAG TPA: hypothetical protein VEW74_09450 [Candidatus Nitrosotalea sp.]|nr:hypothetical protein [Candidatus Nitrosotalea sp.]